MPRPEGYRKALRLMRLAEQFNMPILTFIDTPGAYPGIGAEERGQAEAIAKNLSNYKLVLTARDENRLKETADVLNNKNPGNCIYLMRNWTPRSRPPGPRRCRPPP